MTGAPPFDLELAAREAGVWAEPLAPRPGAKAFNERLARFAGLVRAHEQERCATLCDAQFWIVSRARGGDAAVAAGECAEAIRALPPRL